jgi:hypothetical protein
MIQYSAKGPAQLRRLVGIARFAELQLAGSAIDRSLQPGHIYEIGEAAELRCPCHRAEFDADLFNVGRNLQLHPCERVHAKGSGQGHGTAAESGSLG